MSIDTVTGARNRNMMPGLVSGMDTASLVDSMLSGTKSKIDKENASKQQLLWKQEIYRDIISKSNKFQNDYFTYSGSKDANLLSNSFYNSMTTTSSSGAVKVISTSSNAPSDLKIKVNKLATAFKAKSNTQVSKEMEGKFDISKLTDGKEYSIDISLDGVKKTISFDGVNDPSLSEQENIDKTLENLNKSIAFVFGSTVKASQSGGKIQLGSSNTTHTVIVTATAVKGDPAVAAKDGLELLGFTEGASNKISLNKPIGEVSFLNNLTGESFEFSINGKKITASKNDTINEIIGKINSSDANVRVSYSSSEDRFIMESSLMGDIDGIEIEQTAGNLLSVLFGSGNGSGIIGGAVSTNNMAAKNTVDDTLLDAILATSDKSSLTVPLNVNGKQVVVTVPKNSGDVPYTKAQFIDAFNKELQEMFGKDSAGNANISFSINAGQASFHSSDNYKIKLEDSTQFNLLSSLGFEKEQSQDVKGTTLLSEMGLQGSLNVNGTTITASPNWTIDQLVAELNNTGVGTASFDEKTGVLSISDVAGNDVLIESADSDGSKLMNRLLGTDSVTFNTTGTAMSTTAGSNAELEVNGVAVERNTNQFLVDGVTVQLMETTTDAINLTSSRNTDKIVEGIKSFVDDYNEMIEGFNALIHEKATYSQYPPLTAEQKKDMSESEIKLWEEKAKQGLVRSDNDISALLSNMRSAFYQQVDAAGIGIYDIGIETSGDYKEYGKLTVDDDKLKEAVANNIDGVQKLFMSEKTKIGDTEQQGIARSLDEAIKASVNMSSGSPGTLVRAAGVAGMATDTMSFMYEKLKGMDTKIESLKKQYTSEYNRYWKQFTAMEKMISSMNSQSSWISQQFS